jgi:2-oxoglutarate ferredoxin oxidoreductase subunit delta
MEEDYKDKMGKQTVNNILIDENNCKRCGYCIAFCPVNVYEQSKDGLPLVKRLEECTSCMLCELRCPDLALKLEVINK